MRTQLFLILSTIGLLAGSAGASVVARWTFDEGSGTTAADSIGDYHGTLVNSVSWEDGPAGLGSAVRVHNQGNNEAQSDYVTFGHGITKGPNLSVGVWMKMDAYQHCQLLGQSSGNNSTEPGWFIFPRQNGLMWFVVNGPLGGWNGGHLQLEQSGQDVWYQENEWVHLTFTFDGGTKELTGYVNAIKAHSRIINSSRSVDNCPAEMRIAQVANKANVWDAVIDELVIYDHVLTADEVAIVMEGKIVGIPQAAQPTPKDGAMSESTFAQLSWLPGLSAESHNLYIGTDAAMVERAAEPTIANLTQASLFIGLPMTGDPFPDGLQYGTTYYWRVDEVKPGNPDSPWKGKVWSFTVPSKEAYDPYPRDGMIHVLADQTLSWSAGFGSQTHTVYLGTDPNEVANTDSGGKVVGETTYDPTEPLIAGQTYYWRVDETSHGTVTKGAVWSLTTVPDVAVTDENLVGYWKLDGPDAVVMLDSSGHGLHGEIITEGGSVEWINGAVDGAIRLDGLSDVRTVAPVSGLTTNTVTFTAWIRPDIPVARVWGIIQETGRRVGMQLGSVGGGTGLRIGWPNANYTSTGLVVAPAQWAFVAVVVEPTRATLYLDGKDINEVDQTLRDPVEFNRMMEIGMDGSGYATRFIGAIDDLRFYSRSLTPDEIEQVMQAGTPPLVEDVFEIDSFDGYRVWSYQSAPNVWDTWLDGYEDVTNGALSGNLEDPYMQLSNPAGGTGLALPLLYDNTVATLSEITRMFDPVQDLTREGATSLVIWVRGPLGDGSNPADDVYVVLSDGATEYYQELTTAEEVIDLPEGTPIPWKKVTIAVSDLTIDPTKVSSMTIGVGNYVAPQNGGSGTVFIDNIGLE